MQNYDKRPRRRWGHRRLLAVGVTLALLGTVIPAWASHPEASLPGSEFEIDEDANLKLDDPAPSIDWGSLAHPDGPELRQTDADTGRDDDSYQGGTKEDTACPSETTGSIPNNKSDLLTFHVYEEPGSGSHPGFLNLGWSRVSDPSGTTLMDFEFNQSTTPCNQGPNVVRTEGDLLIEYAIDQGGANAEITGRFWNGSAWGSPIDLDDGTGCDGDPCAVGTINQSVIPASESDGLGEKQPRTFGEAQIDLRLIFDDQKCTSFGSAMLKSRSSDAFNSQLKDFISPIPIDLTNCGKVIIHKATDPASPEIPTFAFEKSFNTDPATDDSFSLADGETATFNNVLFGAGYTVDEVLTSLPAGWDFDEVDCDASIGVTPLITGATVTFDIDDEDDVLECTYYNEARGTIVVEKVTSDGTGTFGFTSETLTPSSFDLTTTVAGEAGKDARTFSDLVPGTFDVAETVPAGWNLTSATCDDGSDPATIGLAAGETVTCTFVNARQTGAIEITKTRKHAALGAGDHPHAGVDFTVTGGGLAAEGVTVTTDDNGEACVDGLLLSTFADDYSVTETVPGGYVADGDTTKTVTVTTESECGDGNEATVSFANTPLTDVTISVDSQAEGGTASTIDCVIDSTSTGANGDGSLTMTDLQPQTLVCTIVIDP